MLLIFWTIWYPFFWRERGALKGCLAYVKAVIPPPRWLSQISTLFFLSWAYVGLQAFSWRQLHCRVLWEHMGDTERCVALEARENRQNSVFPFFILLIRISEWIESFPNDTRYIILFVLYLCVLLKKCFI